MEDINLGRKTVTSARSFSVINGGIHVVPANGRRVGLMFTGSVNGNVTVLRGTFLSAPSAADITNNLFVTMPASRPFFVMRIEEFGRFVQQDFTLFQATGATQDLAFTEIILLE